MNTNLDDVENLLRNLMLSLGHASEILPPRLSLVKAENASRAKQIEHLLQATNIEPIVLAPFDAELFGHWWYEGPMFLNFFRKAVYDQKVFELTTPSANLEKHDTLQILSPSPSSWGNKGFWEVWLDESNSWIYPHLHAAARRMTEFPFGGNRRRHDEPRKGYRSSGNTISMLLSPASGVGKKGAGPPTHILPGYLRNFRATIRP